MDTGGAELSNGLLASDRLVSPRVALELANMAASEKGVAWAATPCATGAPLPQALGSVHLTRLANDSMSLALDREAFINLATLLQEPEKSRPQRRARRRIQEALGVPNEDHAIASSRAEHIDTLLRVSLAEKPQLTLLIRAYQRSDDNVSLFTLIVIDCASTHPLG